MAFFRLVKKSFSLDYRSLAFYRFLIGLIIVSDTIYRMLDLTNFYTDVGLVPRSLFLGEMAMPWSFSLLLANGSREFAMIMFSINLLTGLLVMFGFKTRWAMAFAYLMNVSIHNRNWLINNGGDDILRAILFISIFLPLNKFFSVDSALQREKDDLPDETLSTWGLTFYLQVFVIYFIGWVLKNHPIWRVDFTAVYYSSRLDIFTTPFGHWLRQFTNLQKLTTLATILIEWGAPLFMFFSFAFGRFWWMLRVLIVFVMVAFHVGIALTMWIGVFPYTCMVMWLIFLPGAFWDKLGARFRQGRSGPVAIYFDGECRFCEKAVRIMKEFLLLPDAKIEKAQDHPQMLKLMTENNSWVVVGSQNEITHHYEGFISILGHSPWARFLVFVFGSRPVMMVGNTLYRMVASNRQLMSKWSQYVSFTERKKPVLTFRIALELTGAFFFAVLLFWNLSTIKTLNIHVESLKSVARVFHLYQEWNMFSPFPKRDNIWIESPGVLMDGSEIDVITGERDVYSIKDKAFVRSVRNEHWRKFYLNVSEKTENARYYAGYLCRLWNERNQGIVPNVKLRKMEIIVYSQINNLNDEKGPIHRKLSWKHWCFDADYQRESKTADEK